jgi:hypothetical protein
VSHEPTTRLCMDDLMAGQSQDEHLCARLGLDRGRREKRTAAARRLQYE